MDRASGAEKYFVVGMRGLGVGFDVALSKHEKCWLSLSPAMRRHKPMVWRGLWTVIDVRCFDGVSGDWRQMALASEPETRVNVHCAMISFACLLLFVDFCGSSYIAVLILEEEYSLKRSWRVLVDEHGGSEGHNPSDML